MVLVASDSRNYLVRSRTDNHSQSATTTNNLPLGTILTSGMNIMTQNENLEKNILDWLNNEGFPLEYRCANIFKKWEFSTFQGRYVNDYKTNTPKEIECYCTTNS